MTIPTDHNTEIGFLVKSRGRKRQAVTNSPNVITIDRIRVHALAAHAFVFVDVQGMEYQPLYLKWGKKRPNLSHTLLKSLYALAEPGGRISSLATAEGYMRYLNQFGNWLDTIDAAERIGTHLPLSPDHFRIYKAVIDNKVANKELKSLSAYSLKSAITRVLLQAWHTKSESLSSDWSETDFYHDDYTEDGIGNIPYSSSEASRIIDSISSLLRDLRRDETILDYKTLQTSIKTSYRGAVREAAIQTGIGLTIGIEPECLMGLRLNDVVVLEGGKTLKISYIKNRVQNEKRRRVKNIEADVANQAVSEHEIVEIGTFKSAGGLLSYAIGIARDHKITGDDSLWPFLANKPRSTIGKTFRTLSNILYNRGLRSDQGEKLSILRPKFRVTYKTTRMLKTRGKLSIVADDHSVEISAKHYLEHDGLKPHYEAAIADAAIEAYQYALEKPKIIPIDESTDVAKMNIHAQEIGVTPDEMRRALQGETDVWIASCRDFYNSPFDEIGSPCSQSFWGCFNCGNALITRRLLPRIIRFLSHTIEQRKILTDQDWSEKFGSAYQQITRNILPRFSADAVEEAMAVAKGLDSKLHFPPELMG